MYVAIKNDIIYEGDSLADAANEIFDIEVTITGFIIVDGIPDSISYRTESYTRAEMFADFMAHRAKTLLIRAGYKIYKEIE